MYSVLVALEVKFSWIDSSCCSSKSRGVILKFCSEMRYLSFVKSCVADSSYSNCCWLSVRIFVLFPFLFGNLGNVNRFSFEKLKSYYLVKSPSRELHIILVIELIHISKPFRVGSFAEHPSSESIFQISISLLPKLNKELNNRFKKTKKGTYL